MEIDKTHIVEKIWVNFCRLLLGALFVFSGFVKAVDPLGFYYKIEDYLAAFGMTSWISPGFSLLMGIVLPAMEFGIGVFLLLGIRRKMAAALVLLFMLVATPLTFYLALTNPVSDCGCFGDAWVLTNWQTFVKNAVLLMAAISVFKWQELQVRFITPKIEWMISMYTFLFVFFLSFYCLQNLPILDFRPYKIGKNIRTGMEIPEGAKPSVFESRFVLEKNGERREFTLEDYPDSTWTFIKARTILKEKGYEPSIHDFSMTKIGRAHV